MFIGVICIPINNWRTRIRIGRWQQSLIFLPDTALLKLSYEKTRKTIFKDKNVTSKTARHTLRAILCAVLLIGLAACDEKPPSDIKAQAVIEAIANNDDKAWDAVRGQKIRWQGKVVQTLMIHGDDFIEEHYLRFDPGFGPGALGQVKIDASQAKLLKPGQPVTVTALILSYEKENQLTVVKLGSGKID